jgi:hypothetical protein
MSAAATSPVADAMAKLKAAEEKAAAKAAIAAEKAAAKAAAEAEKEQRRKERNAAREAKAAAKAAMPKRPRGRPRKNPLPTTATVGPGTVTTTDGETTDMDNMSTHSSVHFDADSDSEIAILRTELSALKARHAALETAYQKTARMLDAIRCALSSTSIL